MRSEALDRGPVTSQHRGQANSLARRTRCFLEALRRSGDLVEVDARVDPRLEVAEIHRRVIAGGGPALLFHNPIGSSFPIVTNLFGTQRRVQIGFGDHGQKFLSRLVHLAETMVPPSLPKMWGARDVAGTLLKVGMRKRRAGAVLEVQDPQLDLDALPIITCWPGLYRAPRRWTPQSRHLQAAAPRFRTSGASLPDT